MNFKANTSGHNLDRFVLRGDGVTLTRDYARRVAIEECELHALLDVIDSFVSTPHVDLREGNKC